MKIQKRGGLLTTTRGLSTLDATEIFTMEKSIINLSSISTPRMPIRKTFSLKPESWVKSR